MIIAHGPTIHESGSVPHRIVLRQLNYEYVVHTETLTPNEAPSYHWGSYFRFTDYTSKQIALREAWDKFSDRVKSQL